MKNKIKLPTVAFDDRGLGFEGFWNNVKKAEMVMRKYVACASPLAVTKSNCEYGSIEDYIKFYCDRNKMYVEELFSTHEKLNDSPLERALYYASGQEVLFNRGDEKYYFDYNYGPHSEYRIYHLRRVEE